MALDIICASSLTLGEEVFSRLGRVCMVEEDRIEPDLVRNADLLITRSKTRLDRELLGRSSIRFVGTATAGVDHADEAWLRDAGIHFASAPGCNANSVSEYVCAALHDLASDSGRSLAGTTLGIIGHGNVGKKVEAKARAMGMEVLLNDPPLKDASADPRYLPLEELCRKAAVLTLHVPLVEGGTYPTRRLIHGGLEVSPGMILVNSCRGEVVGTPFLEKALDSGRCSAAMLDVWDPEPAIPVELLERARIGTAHIAGYSFEGKFNGTLQVYEAACSFFDQPNDREDLERQYRALHNLTVAASELETLSDEAARGYCVRMAYDIRADDRLLREGIVDDPRRCAEHFRSLRKGYRRRDEFPAVSVEVPGGRSRLGESLSAMGFRICG